MIWASGGAGWGYVSDMLMFTASTNAWDEIQGCHNVSKIPDTDSGMAQTAKILCYIAYTHSCPDK